MYDLYKVVWMCMNWNKDLCFYLIWHFLFTQNFLGIQDAALIGSTVNIFIWKKFTIAHKSPDRRDKILDLFSSTSPLPLHSTVVSTQRKLLTLRKMKEKLCSFTWLLFIFPKPGSREINIVTLNNFVQCTAPHHWIFKKSPNFVKYPFK